VGSIRFRRRIRIAPGLTINLGKRGASLSAGPRGLKRTVGPYGTRTTIGLPGTGLSYTEVSHPAAMASPPPPPATAARAGGVVGGAAGRVLGWFIGILVLGGAITFLAQSCSGPGAPVTGVSSTPSPALPAFVAATPAPSRAEPLLSPLAVKITSLPAVERDHEAKIVIKTAGGATCAIDVEYASGQSTASGLGDKRVAISGALSWSWKVGAKTTPGSWPVTINCIKGNLAGSVTKNLVVK
jgi:hypothetical protein